MSNLYNINTPADGQAASIRGDYGLDNLGLNNLGKVYWNLPMEALYEESIFRGEANISRMGPLVVNTGKHTARAAGDKFVVREATTEDKIWWGSITSLSMGKSSMRYLPVCRGTFKDGMFLSKIVSGERIRSTACPSASLPN